MDEQTQRNTALPTDFSHLLAIANEFKTKCPGILLGQNGIFFLDMEIIGNLNLLSKLQINPNDAAQYQLCLSIMVNLEKLNSHLKEMSIDHPSDYNQLLNASYYLHLEAIKSNITTLQENTFLRLHSARHLISALQMLKKFDTKEYGALHQLMNTLENTFSENNLSADDKLKTIMQQIHDAYETNKNIARTPMKLFGMQLKSNPLTLAFEAFINNDMAAIAKSNGIEPLVIKNESTPTLAAQNRSTIP